VQTTAMYELNRSRGDYQAAGELTHPARQGKYVVFESIYQQYCDYVRSVCLRMLRNPAEVEDVTQDVFVNVFLKLHTFRGESTFSTWLYRLTTNQVLMRFRKNKQNHVSLDELLNEDGDLDSFGGPDLHLYGAGDRVDLQAAMDRLPDGCRTVFVLHDIQGYGHQEIAELIGYSIGNSKSQLHKARRRLRRLLGRRQGNAGQQEELEAVC